MHGQVKIRTTEEQEKLRKIERAKKVAEYKCSMGLILQKRKEAVWDDELLSVIERVLFQNPDIYTLWNIRREALAKENWSEKEYEERLRKELTLTEGCLRENPKSYNVWHHRCWVINHLSEPNYKTELSLCAKCLDIDERNFHCWNYRNFIVKKAEIADIEEFEFSTKKILNNFSNYSSWHYRSKLLSRMFPDDEHALSIKAEKYEEELDLVMNATFTDPNDTSAWFYQRWLLECWKINLARKVWRVQLSKFDVIIVLCDKIRMKSSSITLSLNEEDVDCHWQSLNNETFSRIWRAKFQQPLIFTRESKITFKLNDDIFSLSHHDNLWIYQSRDIQCAKYNEVQLREQLKNYEQLSELEPENKWAILTKIFLMISIDYRQFHSDILANLDLLLKLDKMRFNYYEDLRSMCLINYHLNELSRNEDKFQFSKQINLSGLGLTILFKEEYFGFFEEINLGANELNNCLNRFYALVKCKKLSLSSNNIDSISMLPTLPELEVLSLRNNQISSLEEVVDLVKRHSIMQLDIRDNPVCEYDIWREISMIRPNMILMTN